MALSLGGALGYLGGFMADVGYAVPAAQEYEQNRQRIEMGKMQVLMEKQKMQSEQDFGKAMEDLSAKSMQPGADNSAETRLKTLYSAALKTKNMQAADKIAGQLSQLEEYKQTQERLKQQHEDNVADRRQRERELEMYRASLLGLKKEQIEKPGGAKISFQERSAANTMNTTMREAGISMENLSQLTQQGSVHTTAGAFENISDHGVFGATSKVMGQSITPQSKQMYTSIMLPLARMASVAQGGGRYKVNDAAVRQSIESFIAQPGQTHMVMLEKMAELKQTLIQGAAASLEAGTMNPDQDKSVRENIEKIEKSIPWNVSDVLEFYNKGGKAENFGDWLKKKTKKEVDDSGWKDM